MYKQGDIVLVPFPFTDLSGEKVRPALILSKKEFGDDVTVCFISSIIPKKISVSEFFVKDTDKSFKNTGLKTSSIIKVNKMATLEKKVILGELGSLDIADISKIKKIIKTHFGV
jgi:mRNA interferase MazF